MVENLSRISKGVLSLARSESKDSVERVKCETLIEEELLLASNPMQSVNVRIIIDTIKNSFLECEPGKTIQILFNLLANAIFAARHGTKEAWIKIGSVLCRQDSFVEIYVEDSGVGIPPSHHEKIMKPFFSTKPPSEGNGLGLSISQNLAVSMGGKSGT
ncbi:MAG: HAMP domain-containing histidine kinase [Proteobacteria bacterium]|nr:MAG: HAMP domain-containing histidine kinase [Pseudomonadota bacterium]